MTTTHLNDLFDGMEPEQGNELDDKIQIERDEVTEELINTLYQLEEKRERLNIPNPMSGIIYNNLDKKYSAKEITKFTYSLTDKIIQETFNYHIGPFINTLIQESPDKNHTIHTQHLTTELNYIGENNTKNIEVHGSTSSSTGRYMKSGTIIVNGNTGKFVGKDMKNGKIIINGNAGREVGNSMSGGTIIVNGNTGSLPGYNMNGGTLIINGDTEDYTGIAMKKGEIHVNGKLNNTYQLDVPGGKIYQNGTLAFYKGYPTPKKIILDIKKHIKQKLTK